MKKKMTKQKAVAIIDAVASSTTKTVLRTLSSVEGFEKEKKEIREYDNRFKFLVANKMQYADGEYQEMMETLYSDTGVFMRIVGKCFNIII